MRSTSVLGLLVCLYNLGCGAAPPVEAGVTLSSDDLASTTALGPGDEVSIRVLGEAALSGVYQVSAEGTIDFPYLGTVEVAGSQPSEVAQRLARGLKDGGYFVDPQVSLLVKETNSKRISFIGAVAKPGSLAYTPGLTIVQAVSLVGGFSALADRNSTVVTRREGDKLRRYTVAAGAMVRGDAEDFVLRPGDIVYVPERIF